MPAQSVSSRSQAPPDQHTPQGHKPCRPVRVAQSSPSGFSGLQCSLGPLRDHFPFVLGNGSEQMQRQPICMGHITRDEIHAAIHHVRYKGDVTRQPVQFRYNERGPVQLARGKCGGKLRPGGFCARLHFNIFGDQCVTAGGDVRRHCCPLCFKAKPRNSLPGRRYAKVADDLQLTLPLTSSATHQP